MPDIEVGFADNGDDGSLIKPQLLGRASVKRESRVRPTKNRVANLTPLRLRWYFNNNNSRFIASRILKRDVNVAARFGLYSNYTAREREPLVLDSGAL